MKLMPKYFMKFKEKLVRTWKNAKLRVGKKDGSPANLSKPERA
jgi:hypothetical protein